MNLFGKKITWLLVVAAALALGVAILAARGASLLSLAAVHSGWFFSILVVAALVDSVNPCAFSVLLLTIAFLFSLGRPRRDIVQVGITYIAGIFLVYIGIGLGVLQTLHFLNVPHVMARIGAALLIAFGAVDILGELFPKFPIRLRIPSGAHRPMARLMERASIPMAFILGAFVGLCEFPCTGGPYLLVLGLLHDRATFLPGLGYLALYNLIFVLPLAVVLAVASDKALLGKMQEWKRANPGRMRFAGGAAMIALGLLLFVL